MPPSLPKSKFIILNLSLGLVLGGTAGWFLPRPIHNSSFIIHNSPPSGPVILPGWSWRDSATPPLLAADPAASAIFAWHALRAPDGRTADFATRADALRALLLRLPATAFPRLLTPFASAKLSDDDRSLRQIAFSAWIEADSSAAATWAAAAGTDLQDLAGQAVSAWATRDARAAAKWACSLPDEPTALRLAPIALRTLAESDSAQALALASTRGDAFLDQLLPSLLDTLAKTDPAAAMRTYGPRLWKEGQGFWQLQGPLREWIKKDPAAAITWTLSQPERYKGNVSSWLGNLATDGPGRLAFANALATLPGLPNRQSSLGQMLFSWTASNPAEAMAWLDTITDRNLRTAILERASRSTYTEHPEKSLPLTLALPEGANRTERLGELLGQWAGKDAPAALAWLHENAALPGIAAASDAVQSTLLATIARDEPATAIAEWQALPEGSLKTKALASITLAWGQTDPAAALTWSAAQSASLGTHTYQATELVYAWARKDGPAALQWAEAITDPNARRYALNALAGNWQDKAPRAATADLYTQIKDPALRTQFVTQHVQEWQSKDPAAAKAWLTAHPELGIKN